MMGTSQSFFLLFRKTQNSARKDMLPPLKLSRHRAGWRPRRLTINPVSRRGGAQPDANPMMSNPSVQDRNRGENQEVNNAHDDRRDDHAQQQPQLRPGSIQRTKDRRPPQRRRDESTSGPKFGHGNDRKAPARQNR